LTVADTDHEMYYKRLHLQPKTNWIRKSKVSHEIGFTPQNFNYGNHHYQYLKYSKTDKVNTSLNIYFFKNLLYLLNDD
jgi:hypothetical protein